MSKKEKSLQEKMKSFFGRRDTTIINFEGMKVEPHVVSADFFKDISSENNVNHRLKAMGDLNEYIFTKRFSDYAVEAICKKIEDLLDAHHSTETRHAAFSFYCDLIKGQLPFMTIMRSYLFRLIVYHKIQDDLIPRLEMLKVLSQEGKTILNFEEEIGPFLLQWFPDFKNAGKVAELLKLITNVIKFNAAYLDDYIIEGFIRNVFSICQSKVDDDIQEGLNILEAVLCYSHLPATALQTFICILCVTVNKEKFVNCSWKQMRNLLGTNIGHTALRSLLMLLQALDNPPSASVVRGAVFFIGMALWGSSRVTSLTHPPTAILPSFLKVLERTEGIIAYEIVLALNKLVLDCIDQILNRSLIWDKMFEIVERILDYPDFHGSSVHVSTLSKAVQEFIIVTQKECPEDSREYLYKIIDQCSSFVNENLVFQLIKYKEDNLKWYKPDFLLNFNQFLEKFFKNEKRPTVQLEAIRATRRVREINMRFFQEDVIDQAVLQNVSQAETVSNVGVREELIELLISVSDTSNSQLFVDALEVIEKIIKNMFDSSVERSVLLNETSKESYSDVLTAVEGLINVFKKKLLFVPSNHCIEVFNLLVDNLQQQYKNLQYSEDMTKIRKLVLEFFFQIRANKYKQIGIRVLDEAEKIEGTEGNQQTKYSVYILLDSDENKKPSDSAPSSPPPGSPSSIATTSYLKFDKAYHIIITCLKEEKDWNVLEAVLREIPMLLQNKSLILKGNCSVASLCLSLCNLINDRKQGFPETLQNAPSSLTRTDIHGRVFPCVAALTSYHSNLESHVQRILIKCLQSGLVSRSAKICMEGMTLCILEMQNSMVKLLPDVLLKLSKISATKVVAVSVLEFLSNLIRLPHLYVSFVEDQYMSIFAIALPYTNPFKFNQYTVALAHHVLSMWFLKCRIPFRKDFARFITKGLRNNLNVPRDDNPSASSRGDEEGKSREGLTDVILALHTELMETGLDLMARFTFGMCTNVPQRSPVAEFLLEKGQKTSWLIGNKIVTITTSGCGTKTFKHGLCERCYTSSHEMSKSVESNESVFFDSEVPTSSSEQFQAQRKRHRSAIPRTNTPLAKDSNQTKDDITLHYQRFQDSDSSFRRHTSYVPDTDRLSKAALEAAESKEKGEHGSHLCSCWCTSWAEVHIRRPTGNTSWMMRIQNQLFLPSAPPDVPLSVLSSLLLPQRAEMFDQEGNILPSEDSESVNLNESEITEPCYEGAIDIASSHKTNPPMRRTNSSPDMNTGWLLSLEKESQFATLEGYPEAHKEGNVCDDNQPKESRTISFVDGQSELTKPKNLRLDLSSMKDRSASVQSRLACEMETMNSAPVDKRFFTNEGVQQQPGSFRDRGHTISVMSPSRPTGSDNYVKGPEVNQRSGMSPSFVFLQLFHNSMSGQATHKPLLLQQTEANHRALFVLDHIPPYDTHKIGIVYVGPGQVDNEVAILSNVYGSARYVAFLRGLGNIVELTDTDPYTTYLGGLDTRGEDGQFGLIWHDDVMQVVFHVATFMLNKESDRNRNEKKKHIANDSVMIVYNESREEFEISTITGHVTNAWVIIKPEDFNCNIVTVKHKTEELSHTFGHTESYVVSDVSLPVFVRQMALHANLASLIISRKQQSAKDAQVSNWLERLRFIKRIRSRVMEELKNKNSSESYGFEGVNDPVDYENFTDYI